LNNFYPCFDLGGQNINYLPKDPVKAPP